MIFVHDRKGLQINIPKATLLCVYHGNTDQVSFVLKVCCSSLEGQEKGNVVFQYCHGDNRLLYTFSHNYNNFQTHFCACFLASAKQIYFWLSIHMKALSFMSFFATLKPHSSVSVQLHTL